MSASRAIFIVNADNQLSMMRPSAPPNEDALQKLGEDFQHTISFEEAANFSSSGGSSRSQIVSPVVDGGHWTIFL